MIKSSSKKYQEYCKECNNKVKLCQTCNFFRPTVFDYEDEQYYDEELGVFTLWVWEGNCLNEAIPNIFPAFYHKTKSNKKCKWYITEKEYRILFEKVKRRNLSYEEFKKELLQIREELKNLPIG